MKIKKNILYTAGVAILFVLIWVGYYAISPLFINIEVDDPLPRDQEAVNDEAMVVDMELLNTDVGANVVGTTGHPASGVARIVTADGKNYIRYEDFKTINGPDIYVYLANDLNANDFVSLGKVKATEGNINYEVPSGIDVSDYQYVLTWCKRFGVLFNYADLSELH